MQTVNDLKLSFDDEGKLKYMAITAITHEPTEGNEDHKATEEWSKSALDIFKDK